MWVFRADANDPELAGLEVVAERGDHRVHRLFLARAGEAELREEHRELAGRLRMQALGLEEEAGIDIHNHL